jgi:2-methylaconitate cis-trans-isomerase PrpF
MSGSDSSGGPSAGPSSSPCEKLRLVRNLEAPVHGVADGLKTGDLLNVVLHEGPPVLVVATDASGNEAGGLLPIGQLIDCLKQGFPFVAEVTGTNGGAIQVLVRAAE